MAQNREALPCTRCGETAAHLALPELDALARSMVSSVLAMVGAPAGFKALDGASIAGAFAVVCTRCACSDATGSA